MTGEEAGRSRNGTIVEFVLLLAILAGFAHVVWHLATYGYLRQPFIWDPTDTFMDWYNPAYWAHHEGAYSVWRSVYPPLSFAVLKLFSIPGCYVTTSYAGRDCDWVGMVVIGVSYVAAILASYKAIRSCQPTHVACLRTMAIAFGLPGLFVLERGNLLILCHIALIFAFAPGPQANWKRIVGAGILINFKPYMLVPMAAFAIRREWRFLELAAIATIAIYLASWAFVGNGSLIEILENTANFVRVSGADVVAEVFYTTSYNSLFGLIDRGFPISNHIASKPFDLFRSAAFFAMVAAQATAILAIGTSWLQPRCASLHRLALLLLLMSLINRSPGGYTQILVVFLVFLEPWQRPAQILAIVVAYAVSIPYEWIVSYFPDISTSSWITGEAVTGRFGIGVGQLLRPLGLILMLLALSLDTIGQAIRAHRQHRPALGLAPPGLAA